MRLSHYGHSPLAAVYRILKKLNDLESCMREAPPDTSRVCPGCGSTEIQVYYTAPPMYKCSGCNKELIDENAIGIVVLPEAVSRRKRPAMYGEEVCSCCSHTPHGEEECEFCKPAPPHVYKFRVEGE